MGNVGNNDRLARFVVGVAILSLGYYFGTYWSVVGFIPIITGLFGACPAYSLFWYSSCKMK